MDELISRAALLADIERDIENSGCVNHEREIMDCIRYAPTVPAEPVRHAYWIEIELLDPENNIEGLTYWRCSECEGPDKGIRKPRYCRTCGAKMDLDHLGDTAAMAEKEDSR